MSTKNDNGNMPTNKQKGKKTCSACGVSKNLTDFYASYSPMYATDGRIPICKDCCKTVVLNEDGSINYPAFKQLLLQTDKPLYFDLLWSSAANVKKSNSYMSDEEVELHGESILQRYYTSIVMKQDRAKSFADAEKEGHIHTNSNRTSAEKNQIINKYKPLFDDIVFVESSKNTTVKQPNMKEKTIVSNNGNFEVTQDMIELFGDGYTPSLYKKMYDKYEKLKLNYSLQTNIHQEALATYVRFKVQEEIETAKGNVTEAKKWYDAAQTSAQDAKLTPKQLTKADLDSGVNSISELTKALEQAVDVIKILPRFKYRPNDAPDFNIWCYVDYERKLNDQPPVPYEDIYQFYDKRKEDYITQNGDPYGIFANDTVEKNRETVKTFIKLPDDYDDMAGGDDESN